MSARVAGVVFDLDGTLVDSCADIAAAANHCLRAAGLPERSLEEVRSFIGDGSKILLQRAGDIGPEDHRLQPMLEEFFDFYSAHAVERTRLLPGALEALASVAEGWPLALCTNKPAATTRIVLERLRLRPFFSAVVASGDAEFNKPHAAPLELVAARMQVAAGELVMVGDGPQDVGAARAVGARSIGLLDDVFGHLAALQASKPDVLARLVDVPRVVGELSGGAAPTLD